MEATDVRNEMSGLQELLEARTSDLEKTKVELHDARAQIDTCDKLVATQEKDRAELRTSLDREEAAKKAVTELANSSLDSLNEQEDENEKLRDTLQNMEVEREQMTERHRRFATGTRHHAGMNCRSCGPDQPRRG